MEVLSYPDSNWEYLIQSQGQSPLHYKSEIPSYHFYEIYISIISNVFFPIYLSHKLYKHNLV